MANFKRAVTPAVWGFYLIIVLEILYMISPFALYFYSVYGPWLNIFHQSRWTAWLTGFFLPHFSQTSSRVLNWLPELSDPLVIAGAALFALGFVQIYWAKLWRRGAVTRWLYAYIRHPQYVALAIVGIGTLIHWPRFLVLVMFVTMLFLYYFLARWEEEQCVRKFGDSYRVYQERTGMFFPGGLFKKFPPLLPSAGGKRVAAALALYVIVMAATVTAGYWLRDYSLSYLSTSYGETMAVISPAVLTQEEMSRALQVAQGSTEVQTKLNQAGAPAGVLVYVVPVQWRLPDIPMEVAPGGHHVPDDFDRRLYKVLFTKARTFESSLSGEDIVKKAHGRDPIVLVKVNIETAQITGIETPPPHVRWGDIPTPLF